MILVVILPVAQMILVLIVISLLRVCYVTYCVTPEPEPRLIKVVADAQQQHSQMNQMNSAATQSGH